MVINTALPSGYERCPNCKKEGRNATLSVQKGNYMYCSYTQICKFRQKIKAENKPVVDLEFAHPMELSTGQFKSNLGPIICKQVEPQGQGLRARLERMNKRKGINDPDLTLTQGGYIVSSQTAYLSESGDWVN